MILYRYILIFMIFLSTAYSNPIELELQSQNIHNANVVLITAKSQSANNLKAILDSKEIDFVKHPFKKGFYYVLVPFHYYMERTVHQLIITYTLNNKDYFEGFDINLKEDNYESEKIRVNNSKVTLSLKSKNRVSKEYQEAMRVYDSVTSKSYWYRDFIYPMQSKITSAFGTKRVYNSRVKSYHTGIDFKADINSSVQASNNGVVKIVKNRFYAGNSIIIDHGQGIYTCYFHLNKIFVSEGDFVQREDIIGLSGNTGRTTGPHLHFATFVNGIQVNPIKLFETLNSLNN